MAYLARTLITNAWYWSGIVARDLQVVSADQTTDGVYLLNNLLSQMSIDEKFIPYITHSQINCVVGQETYFVPGLVYLEELTFNLADNSPVRFPMIQDTRRRYFASGRIDNIQALPFHYYYERVLNGGTIYLYFLPEDTFLLKITGKFLLNDVTIDTDLSLTYDKFYLHFIELALAEDMCNFYTTALPANTQLKLESLRRKIKNFNPPDISIKKFPIIGQRSRYGWAQVNIGHGYEP